MNRTTARRGKGVILTLLMLLVLAGSGIAHVFPHHSDPRVGSTVTTAPGGIRIWFDGDLEGAFSKMTVLDSSGKQVDKRDCRVDPSDPKLLSVSLQPLRAGTFRVIWSVAGRDGHRTEGDYTFTLQ